MMSERRSELKAAAAAAEDWAEKMPGRDMMRLTARWVENWGRINGKLMGMAQSSLRASVEAMEELRQCQSPGEMVETQIRLARQAYDDYCEDARELSEIMTKMSSDALSARAETGLTAR